jgi:transcription elongation factor GreB
VVSKAFVRDDGESAPEDEDVDDAVEATPGGRNYITPAGYARLRSELLRLLDVERPEVVRTVTWAASNGDRSENADYTYGKRRLREIDRRVRFLTRRLERAEVVDPARQQELDQVFFGATVTYLQSDGVERTVQIVGVDEVDPLAGRISWVSPVARALLKAREGDTVSVQTPAGPMTLEVLGVRYEASSTS